MRDSTPRSWLAAAAAVAVLAACGSSPQSKNEMSFFVSSTGSGKGADLGGLTGADALCQRLATAAGSTKTWHAYVSTQGPNAVNSGVEVPCAVEPGPRTHL